MSENANRMMPVQTAPSETVYDEATGEAVRFVEHFAQGGYRYRIIWDLTESGEEPRIESDDETSQTSQTI